MLEIANRSPFPAAIGASVDREGADWANVAVKGTFAVGRGPVPEVAAQQVPIWVGDQHWGDPESSSVRYASDLGPEKPGTDVVLLGHAYARGGRARVRDVALQVGRLCKAVRVFGERRWVRSAGAWIPSNALEFDRVPLVWERAYGGRDASRPGKIAIDPRNPVGTGFAAAATRERLEGLALPNLEEAEHPITAWDSRPAPACFGFLGPSWAPRSGFAGTFDDAWRERRFPLLPTDFDVRFHNAAPRDLVTTPHLVGGEQVVVVGATRDRDLTFKLPQVRVVVTAIIRGTETPAPGVLDTVVIEPDQGRVALTWRASFPCTRQFARIAAVLVEAEVRA